jgi:CMP-N-acetylneuraminic acid synthetase
MKNINDILFLIPARTGSTRVVNKMLKPFANTTLMDLAIDKILQSSVILKENFYLHVGDKELIKLAEKRGIKHTNRSFESLQEPVTLQRFHEWTEMLDYKYFIIINACNPLLKVDTIDNFVKRFLEVDSNGLFGVFEKKTFLFNSDGVMINRFFGEDKYLATLETKFVETCYEAAHSLYAGSTEDLKNGIYMGSFKQPNDPNFFVMDEIECFDIDWPWQFEIAEKLYLNK